MVEPTHDGSQGWLCTSLSTPLSLGRLKSATMELISPGHQEILYQGFFFPHREPVVKHFTNTANPILPPTIMYDS